jgi:uncharacterized protein (DUF58 family)
LEQLGFGLIALVAIAVAFLRLGRHDVAVTRKVAPTKVHAGHDVRIALRLDNLGEGPAPSALIEDQIPTEVASKPRFVLDGLRPAERRDLDFTLRPSRRGSWTVGPLTILYKDPFGVAALKGEDESKASFLVYPRSERLVLPQVTSTRRTMSRSARRRLTGTQGEDFYTLREYVEGDDLRRIHWPATAKRGRYMIRQEETPWQAGATVVLDDRADACPASAWERAVEAAASLADLYARSGYTFTLCSAHEVAPGTGRGADHLEVCLEHLARLDRKSTKRKDADPLLGRLATVRHRGGSLEDLVLVLGTLNDQQAEEVIRAAANARTAAVISVGTEPTETLERIETAGIRTLRLSPGQPLAGAWQALWARRADAGGGDRTWDQRRAPV